MLTGGALRRHRTQTYADTVTSMLSFRHADVSLLILNVEYLCIYYVYIYSLIYLTFLCYRHCFMIFYCWFSPSHFSVVSWVALTFWTPLNQFSLSEAHSGCILCSFISCFNHSNSIHFRLSMPLLVMLYTFKQSPIRLRNVWQYLIITLCSSFKLTLF